jgi:hypothetical protein
MWLQRKYENKTKTNGEKREKWTTEPTRQKYKQLVCHSKSMTMNNINYLVPTISKKGVSQIQYLLTKFLYAEHQRIKIGIICMVEFDV